MYADTCHAQQRKGIIAGQVGTRGQLLLIQHLCKHDVFTCRCSVLNVCKWFVYMYTQPHSKGQNHCISSLPLI